jgi:hypothetical protein
MTELSLEQRTATASADHMEEEREELEEQLSALTEAEREVQGLIDVLAGLHLEDHDSEDLVEAHDKAEWALTTLSQAINEYADELREQLDEMAE